MRIKLNESHLKKGNFSASYCEYSFGLLIAGQNTVVEISSLYFVV